MSKLSTISSRGKFLGAAIALAAVAATSALSPMLVSADQVSERSLGLSSSAAGSITGDGIVGSATNGQKVTYTFKFTPTTAGDIQSWSAVFCDSAFGYLDGSNEATAVTSAGNVVCSGGAAPVGLDAAKITDPTVTINGGTADAGWTVAAVGAGNTFRITNSTAATLVAGQQVVITFAADGTNYVTNPTSEGTFFAHMTTYSDDAYVTPVDDGTVASSVTKSIGINAKVAETLKFSVGVADTVGTPTLVDPSTTCAMLSSGNDSNTLTLGDVVNGALSPSSTFNAHSYFRVSTNAINGTAIQYAGNTLKSGAPGGAITSKNTIDPVGFTGSAATSANVGIEQFGLTIDSADATTDGYNFTNEDTNPGLVAEYEYDVTNGYSFINTEDSTDVTNLHVPQTIAASAGNIDCNTGSVEYMANIANNTEAGLYRTSINYIAVPKY